MSVIKLLIAAFVMVGVAGELAGCGKKGDLEPPPAKEDPKQEPQETSKKTSKKN